MKGVDPEISCQTSYTRLFLSFILWSTCRFFFLNQKKRGGPIEIQSCFFCATTRVPVIKAFWNFLQFFPHSRVKALPKTSAELRVFKKEKRVANPLSIHIGWKNMNVCSFKIYKYYFIQASILATIPCKKNRLAVLSLWRMCTARPIIHSKKQKSDRFIWTVIFFLLGWQQTSYVGYFRQLNSTWLKVRMKY